MDMTGFVASALPAVLAALGAWFLVREVSHAHEFEALGRDMNEAQEFLTLFRTDPREFWKRSAMISFHCDRAKAEELAAHLGDTEIDQAAQEYKDFWDTKVVNTLDRWNRRTAPAQLQKRRKLLWAGFWLLMASASIQVIAAANQFFNG